MSGEVDQFSHPAIGVEIVRRQLAGYSNYEVAEMTFRANTPDNALQLPSIILPGGIAHPLNSRVSVLPQSSPYQRTGDSFVVQPAFTELPVVTATFVAFWDKAEEAAVYQIERDLGAAATETFEMPVGEVALVILGAGRNSRLPDTEAQIFSGYPVFDRIDYISTEDTTIEVTIEDAGSDSPTANFSVSGRIGVLHKSDEYYFKVEGNEVLIASSPETGTTEIELPAGLVNPKVRLPAGSTEIHRLGNAFVAVQEGSVAHLEAVDSFETLYQKALRIRQDHDADPAKLVEDVLGISFLGLPDIGTEGHAVIAKNLDWVDHTVQFLLTRRTEVHKLVAVAGEHVTIQRAQAAIKEALEDTQNPISASVVGPLAVAAHLLDRSS